MRKSRFTDEQPRPVAPEPAREDLLKFGAALRAASCRKGEEHASPHSITSSARASTDG